MKFCRLTLLAIALLSSRGDAQTHVMVPESDGDRVVLLDASNGAIVDANFIIDDPTGTLYAMQGPKEAVQVGDQIWVTDQFADSIFCFDLEGNYIDTIDFISASLDNLRGACFANGIFYVAMDGTQFGATQDTVVQFDPSGNRIGSFTAGPSPFDVLEFNGELLVADFFDNTIGRYSYSGNFLGNFYVPAMPGGINQMEQISLTSAGGVVAAGFEIPSGLYTYDGAGNPVGFLPGNNARGVYELPGGIFLATLDDLVLVDPVSGAATVLDSNGTFQFASPLDLTGRSASSFCFGDGGVSPGCTPCPCSNDGFAGSGGGCVNSNGTNGRLLRFGTPSVSGDTLRFEVRSASVAAFGILSSGDDRLPRNAANPCFGSGSGVDSVLLDGLRCIGGGILRHGTRPSDLQGDIGETTGGWGPPNGPQNGLIAQNAFVAGQTRHFQCFYRENPALGCGTGQNTTQGVSILFQP